MNIQLITADLALLLCPVALSAATPKQSTLRVVASTQQISQPQGLWQVSPTLFYTTSNQTILSVTTGGEVAVLFVAPSGYNIGYVPVTAPNNRSYSAYGSEGTSYQISLKASPNSVETYPVTTVGGGFIQGLPDGTLFGVGSYFSTGAFYLATGAEDGVVTPLYQFPSYQVPMSPIYGSDGNYYGVSWAYEGSLAGSSYVFQVTPAGAFTKIAPGVRPRRLRGHLFRLAELTRQWAILAIHFHSRLHQFVRHLHAVAELGRQRLCSR
jgi:hypothetical protein